MKELTGIRVNNGLIDVVNDRFFSEIILVVTEPDYQYSDGEITRIRETETHRFIADTKQLETMINALQKVKDDNQEIIEGLEQGKEADNGD